MWSSRLLRYLLLSFFLILLARPVDAGDGVWTTLNPAPFGPTDLAIHPGSPGIVYAVGERLTLVSRDGGGEWALAEDVPPGTDRLIFDPLTPSILYAVINGEIHQRIGVGTWKTLAPGLLKDVKEFLINPDNPNQLWAITQADLLRSENSGGSWTKVPLPVAANDVTALALGWPSSTHVYVTVANQGFLHSSDGGIAWSQASKGLEGAGIVYALQADGLTPGTLYLAAAGGLYRSADHGATWMRLDPPESSSWSTILLWTGAGGGTLYTVFNNVLYRSEDRGTTWKASQPFPQAYISQLVAEPGNPQVMYAIVGGAVLKSFDAGMSWTPPPSQSGYIVVGAHPTQAGLLLANHVTGGAWRSTDGGLTWTAMSQGWPDGQSIGALHIHAGDPNRIYAAAGNTLLVSRDAGQSWLATSMPTADKPLAITTAPNDPAIILVSLGRTVLRSSDAGTFWWSSVLPNNAWVNDLWLSPEDPMVALAATTQGLYRSTNGGIDWEPVEQASTVNYRTLWSGASLGEVYAAADTGLFLSKDAGVTWTNMETEISVDAGVGHPLHDWSDPNVLYATLNDRILISPNGGLHWMPVGGKLAFTPAYLAADGLTPRHLYADDAQGLGPWRLSLREIPPTLTPTPTPTPTSTPTATPTATVTATLTIPALMPLSSRAATDFDAPNGSPSKATQVLGGLAVLGALVVGGLLWLRSRFRSRGKETQP